MAALAEQLARSPDYPARLAAKARQLAADGKQRPLATYRAAELTIMRHNFSGPSEPYAQLRQAFVYKDKPPHTPPHLARHRTHPRPFNPERPRAQRTTTVLAGELIPYPVRRNRASAVPRRPDAAHWQCREASSALPCRSVSADNGPAT